MENLTVDLLRVICMNLNEPDLGKFIMVNKKCSQIPTQHFWFQKILHAYPDKINTKSDDLTWGESYYQLTHPIVNYYDVYKINIDTKVKFRDSIIMHPTYKWKKVEPIKQEELEEELEEIRKLQQESRSEFYDLLREQMRNPDFKSHLITFCRENKALFNEKQQQQIESFCENPEYEIFKEEENKILFSNQNQDKIFILTTKEYQLIALIDKEKKFVINENIYPEAYYLFGISNDIYVYDTLKEVISELDYNDKIGISYLLDGIKRTCSDIIEDSRCSTPASLVRLIVRLKTKEFCLT